MGYVFIGWKKKKKSNLMKNDDDEEGGKENKEEEKGNDNEDNNNSNVTKLHTVMDYMIPLNLKKKYPLELDVGSEKTKKKKKEWIKAGKRRR